MATPPILDVPAVFRRCPPEIRPTIVIDTREQRRLVFTTLKTVEGGLTTGDYSILGLEDYFCVERKELGDLVACCKSSTKRVEGDRERFCRELHRMRGYQFKRVLVEGTEDDIRRHDYKSQMEPRAVLHTLYTFTARYGVTFEFGGTRQNCALLVERWAYWYSREWLETTGEMLRTFMRLEKDMAKTQVPSA